MITSRLDLISHEHFGDHKRFDGLVELRWRSGIRVYAFQRNNDSFVVLLGGNKNGQNHDIKKAKKIKDQFLYGSRSL